MKTVLDHSVPFERYFEEILAPHSSKNEKAIAEHNEAFRGLVVMDKEKYLWIVDV